MKRAFAVLACLAALLSGAAAGAKSLPLYGDWTPIAGQSADQCPPTGSVVTFAEHRFSIRSPRGTTESADVFFFQDRDVVAVKGQNIDFRVVIVDKTINVQGCRMQPATR